jgi:acyl-CoA thioesterase
MNRIKKFLQTHDQFVQHNGIKLTQISRGHAIAKMKIQKYHFNSVNVVQGGAIFTLADFAFAAASNSYGSVALGISVNIFFVKSAMKGTLIAEAKETSVTPKLATYQVTVTDQKKEIIAIFQGMVYRKKERLPVNN